MKKPGIFALLLGFLFVAAVPSKPAHACGPVIEVAFYEGGPDVFVVENQSKEPWTLLTLDVVLTGSAGKLVFDTEEGGPGFNSPYQFEAVDNEVGLTEAPMVTDGAEKLSLHFLNFQPDRSFAFTIDLDDRVETTDWGQGVISGGEIKGAQAKAYLTSKRFGEARVHGTFGTDGRARLRGATCV